MGREGLPPTFTPAEQTRDSISPSSLYNIFISDYIVKIQATMICDLLKDWHLPSQLSLFKTQPSLASFFIIELQLVTYYVVPWLMTAIMAKIPSSILVVSQGLIDSAILTVFCLINHNWLNSTVHYAINHKSQYVGM